MIKLTDILKEIKVNDPHSKPNTYNDLKNISWNLLRLAISILNDNPSDPVQAFLDDFGYYDDGGQFNKMQELDALLENEWGMEDIDERQNTIKALLNFFRAYKPGDFYYEGFGPNDDLGDISQYKYVDVLGEYDRDYGTAIIASNRINIGENELYNI